MSKATGRNIRERFEVYVASTRPVRLRGDDYITQFTHNALEDMVAQMRDQYVWLNVEHLEFLPPLGRWKEAELRACDDGEHELFFIGEAIPHYVTKRPGSDEIGPLDDLPTAVSPSLAPKLNIDRRNYDGYALSGIADEADFPVQPRERWAELPPLEFSLLIPVIWGCYAIHGLVPR